MANSTCLGPQLLLATLQGTNGASDITVPGVQVNDLIIAYQSTSVGEGTGTNNMFTALVSSANIIHQSYTGDLSSATFNLVLLRF